MSMRNITLDSTIRSISGSEPHEDHGGWRNFLDTCEVRDTIGETIFYGLVNCNYILLPNSVVICNYGYHGRALMGKIRKRGWKPVFNEIKSAVDELKRLLRG